MIKFRCGSLASFDPVSQQYVTCDNVIECDESQAGRIIECPVCGNEVSVPGQRGSQKPAREATKTSSSETRRRTTQASSAQPTPSASARRENAASSASMDDELSVAPATERAKPPSTWGQGSELDRELGEVESRPLAFNRFDQTKNCVQCGAFVPPDAVVCPNCGMARRINRDQRELKDIKVQPAGMQRWLRSLIDPRHQNSGAIAIMDQVLIVAVTLVFVPVMILALGIIGTLVALCELTLATAYLLTSYRFRQMQQVPGLPLWPWQRSVWNLLVPILRKFQWPLPHAKERKVVDLRERDLKGVDLFSEPGVSEAQVVDLTGTNVTDQEIVALQYAKQLKGIVLIDTQVSDEGVFRLQQSVLPAWIWY